MSANVVLLPLIKFELNEIDGFKHKSQFYYKRGFANTVVGPLYAFFFLFAAKYLQLLSGGFCISAASIC